MASRRRCERAIDEINNATAEARTSGDVALLTVARGRRPGDQPADPANLRSAITTYSKQNPSVLDINPAALIQVPCQ